MLTKEDMKLFALFLLGLLTFVMVGCGGSGTSAITPTANPFAGSYTSTMTLDSGKQGSMNLAVSSTGAATGNLTVSAARSSREGGFSFTIGTISITGNVNPDGSFSLSGNDPTSGNFGASGQLNSSSSGTITVTAGGQTYEGGVTLGTGSSSLTFTNVSGVNGTATNFPSNPYVVSSTVGGASAILILPSVSENTRSFAITLNSTALAGDVIPLTGILNQKAWISYSTATDRDWDATGGTLEILARSGNTWSVRLNAATFTARTTGTATGTFTASGTVTKN
jgi:hypothetical protein